MVVYFIFKFVLVYKWIQIFIDFLVHKHPNPRYNKE